MMVTSNTEDTLKLGDTDMPIEVFSDHMHLEHALRLGMIHYQDFRDVPAKYHKRIRPSVFPPSPEEASWMHLGWLVGACHQYF